METKVLQYYKPKVLIGFIVILSIGIYFAKEKWGIQLAILGTVVSLIVIISKYLWKYLPFSLMFWTENFSGQYEGELEYQYYDKNGDKHTGRLKHKKIIKQTGNSICISSFTIKTDGTKSSVSTSLGLAVDKYPDGHFRLIYNYLNDGDSSQGFSPHYGTDIIKIIKKSNGEVSLSGNYYTDRIPYQTKGQYIDLKKTSNNLIHEF